MKRPVQMWVPTEFKIYVLEMKTKYPNMTIQQILKEISKKQRDDKKNFF